MKFNAQPLNPWLDKIYDFVGGLRGVREVDLASPIQLVHDVGRAAALQRSGFFTDRTTHNHVATGNLFTVIGTRSLLTDPDDFWLWVIDVGVTSEIVAGNSIDDVLVSLATGPDPSDNGSYDLGRFDLVSTLPAATAGFARRTKTSSVRYPIFVPTRSSNPSIVIASAATVAAGDIDTRVDVRFWNGPRGTPPPIG